MADTEDPTTSLGWADLSRETKEFLKGKLAGLWGAESDATAFDSWALDKKYALLLLLHRMRVKGLWHLVKRIDNVYGEGGVGLQFEAWPMIESTLSRRPDFTRRFANHNDTSGGFYEKDRDEAVLHFLFQEGKPRIWYVHFDLYSPVHSPGSAWKHLRYEFLSKTKPDWRRIAKSLNVQI
ncbi:MAG TPA: hypothetical protein VJR02_05755 [Pyrinomonadaceae bacterium]|nr:hypothetical protein [Pyrinomonadaceae bacterium]